MEEERSPLEFTAHRRYFTQGFFAPKENSFVDSCDVHTNIDITDIDKMSHIFSMNYLFCQNYKNLGIFMMFFLTFNVEGISYCQDAFCIFSCVELNYALSEELLSY